MSSRLHKTKGIVLRSVKYGETSLVVTCFTELFGVQSYLVNGVRVHTKKGTGRAGLFQPPAILDLVVYHNELKHLNRIREFRWGVLFRHILSDVRKNAVALFMAELLSRCLKQPESNPELYAFTEDCLLHLDEAGDKVTANFPLFFSLHLTHFFGFRVDDNYSAEKNILDLQEGLFTSVRPGHPHILEDKQAFVTSQVLKMQQPAELETLLLHHDFRRNLLLAYEKYFALHIQDFGTMKSLPVLREILK